MIPAPALTAARLPAVHWMQLCGQRRAVFAPFQALPDLSTLTLSDLAAMLAKINRFGGATFAPYSVAQHSVHVSLLVKKHGGGPAAQMAGLMHDAHEAFTGDIPTPIKRALSEGGRDALHALQTRIDVALGYRFGCVQLTAAERDLVKMCDLIALVTEARDLLPGGPLDNWIADFDVEPDRAPITPQDWRLAESYFKGRFVELDSSRN
jgi:hypothetical protein